MKCKFFVITLKRVVLSVFFTFLLILHFCLYFTNSKYNYVVKCFTNDLVNSFSTDKNLHENKANINGEILWEN